MVTSTSTSTEEKKGEDLDNFLKYWLGDNYFKEITTSLKIPARTISEMSMDEMSKFLKQVKMKLLALKVATNRKYGFVNLIDTKYGYSRKVYGYGLDDEGAY